jgi:DNA polymerase (family 10)
VLASLHDRAGHRADQLLRALRVGDETPAGHVITHPTNRLVPSRPGYDLDYDRLFELAVETGHDARESTARRRISISTARWRAARLPAGVTLAIDSDCHRADMLDRQMHLAIVTARRGWVEPRHVLNTRPLDEVRAVIAAKRDAR